MIARLSRPLTLSPSLTRPSIYDAFDAPDEFPVTELLARAKGGDSDARNRVWGYLYEELRRLAGVVTGDCEGRVQRTELLSEAFVRMAKSEPSQEWSDRRHFLGYALRVMKSILIDHARRRAPEQGPLGDLLVYVESRASGQVVEFFEAIERFRLIDAKMADVVQLTVLGYSREEILDMVGIAQRTLERHYPRAIARVRLLMS